MIDTNKLRRLAQESKGAVMTPTEVTTILRQYREWLCDTPKSVRPHTRQINEAIDAAVEMIERIVWRA